ncbi:ETC complex I subunit putative region [Rubellimicrobium thermophilum DSM 16684]|uniref:ETC complex I subunit putative region n=1 Tax=Rubellimicrobium thermophilum DSM 16684 TaxID=1123069 RepID=S9R219_9RHOB|nr:NADH dehydrogenase ubiquinone Fe-S protein 4 [Rubellimicrobium thermophilum]EPX87696.1 ETC complex I subunit putative region [Rubellimicrobium thermophilum DSM 16684]
MRGHNRPPFAPKIPGTDLRSWDVPMAIIYRPARSAMTSAPRPNFWILEFEPSRPLQIDPLMGYTSSDDAYRPIRLKFPDRDSAVEFAERQDWRYIVREDAPPRAAPNPWRGQERHRLYKGADAPGAVSGFLRYWSGAFGPPP